MLMTVCNLSQLSFLEPDNVTYKNLVMVIEWLLSRSQCHLTLRKTIRNINRKFYLIGRCTRSGKCEQQGFHCQCNRNQVKLSLHVLHFQIPKIHLEQMAPQQLNCQNCTHFINSCESDCIPAQVLLPPKCTGHHDILQPQAQIVQYVPEHKMVPFQLANRFMEAIIFTKTPSTSQSNST